MTKWIDKLAFKFRRYGIDNLMLYITGAMLAVYVAENLNFTEHSIYELLVLNTRLLFQGQIWRLITFLFIPLDNMILWVLLSLYLYYFIGNSLANAWGSTKFTLFYLFGVIGAIIAALISGYGNNMFLNMSLFLAYAALWPEQELLILFVIPVKVKILAYIDLAMLALLFIVGTWSMRAAILFSLLNLILFFGDELYRKLHDFFKYRKVRSNFRKSMKRQRDMYGR